MINLCRSVPPFNKNGYIAACSRTRDAVLIDPGDEVGQLLADANRAQLRIRLILLTHAHLDHITGVDTARRASGAPVWLHAADQPLYERVVQQGQMFGIRVEQQSPVDHFYGDQPLPAIGDLSIQVHPTPGHSPGGVALEINQALFVGDTLFAGSVGRTDLPGGDHDTLINSIRTVLFAFPDGTPVFAGHGPETTIGRERLTNPYVRG